MDEFATNSPGSNSYFTQRVHSTGSRLFTYGTPISLIMTVMDLFWGHRHCLVSDLLVFSGFLMSLALEKFSRRQCTYAWVPGYLGFWAGSIPILYFSGGAESPYFGLWMVLLFLGALVVQDIVSMKYSLGFACLNVCFWVAVSAWGAGQHTRDPIMLSETKLLILLLGAFLCAIDFVITRGDMAAQAIARYQELNEVRMHLTHTARLVEMGNLVAGTVHEIAQPVQVISNAVTVLQKFAEKDGAPLSAGTLSVISSRISDSCNRISRLLGRLRDLSRRGPFEPKPFDLNEAVDTVVEIVRPEFASKRCGLQVALEPLPHLVNGDQIQLQQVLLNLLNNARDACSGAPSALVTLELRLRGCWIRTSVSHNGPIIPLDVQYKLFQPYFTTKAKGTGLGLTICSQIVETHHGRIFFTTEPGRTVFLFEIPQAPQDQAAYCQSAVSSGA